MNGFLPGWAVQMNTLGKERIPFLFVIDFDMLAPSVIPLADISNDCIRFEMNPVILSDNAVLHRKSKMSMDIYPVEFDIYEKGFERVLKAIHQGDTYLLNLCYSTRLSTLPPLEVIFESVKAPYKLLFQNQFVVFSPEQFVSMQNGLIKTFPMKGTIDASVDNAEEILLQDVKEQEEHATVVDLLRNDLSIVAKKVTVERYRYISEIRTAGKTLLQCSSEIRGQLDDNYLDHLGTIFHALLPAGSVTGAPKKRTVELIKEIEPETRGYYTGIFGVFDGQDVDSAVMIRMIEQRRDGFYYRSGGGITYRSTASQEYQEMIDKVYIPVLNNFHFSQSLFWIQKQQGLRSQPCAKALYLSREAIHRNDLYTRRRSSKFTLASAKGGCYTHAFLSAT